MSTSIGDLKESDPYTYQSNGKERAQVRCKYLVTGNILRFQVKDHDPNSTGHRPALIFCSFSGSSADNWGFTATYGPDGSFYGGGIVFAGNSWPVSPGAFETVFQGGVDGGGLRPCDIGIIKLSSNGGNRCMPPMWEEPVMNSHTASSLIRRGTW